MVPQPLKLTQEQLEQMMRIAGPIPPDLRGDYLQRVADALRGTEFGDGRGLSRVPGRNKGRHVERGSRSPAGGAAGAR